MFDTLFSRVSVSCGAGVSIVHGGLLARQRVPSGGTWNVADWKIVPLLSSVAAVKKSR